jgi:hypothetical protein
MNLRNCKMNKKAKLVRNLPAARFYYKGSHSHPVRRTVLVTEVGRNVIRGYELREGSDVREFSKSLYKTYSRSKIATTNQCRKDNKVSTKKNKTTLKRVSLKTLVFDGV